MVMRVCDELLAALYDGVGTIYASEPLAGESGWADGSCKTVLYEDIPCHLAFERNPEVGSDLLGEVQAVCVLFCGAEYEIAPGSRVLVRQNGREYRLALTGLPRVYAVHQELRAALLSELA